MDINQALGIAKSLKNHFKAFEFLDEFIKKAVAIENLMDEWESRKADYQKQMEDLRNELIVTDEQTRKFKEEKRKQMDAMETDYQSRKNEIATELSNDVSEAKARKEKAENEADEAEKIGTETRQRIEQETASLVASREAAKKALQDIKAKLE